MGAQDCGIGDGEARGAVARALRRSTDQRMPSHGPVSTRRRRERVTSRQPTHSTYVRPRQVTPLDGAHHQIQATGAAVLDVLGWICWTGYGACQTVSSVDNLSDSWELKWTRPGPALAANMGPRDSVHGGYEPLSSQGRSEEPRHMDNHQRQAAITLQQRLCLHERPISPRIVVHTTSLASSRPRSAFPTAQTQSATSRPLADTVTGTPAASRPRTKSSPLSHAGPDPQRLVFSNGIGTVSSMFPLVWTMGSGSRSASGRAS